MLFLQTSFKLEMWANAQRDGRPAKHRWCPLFNAAKFGWRWLLDCRAVMLPRRESRWNLLACPKQVNRSQPLVGPSSPCCGDMWRTYCCLTSFFSDCQMATFLRPVFSVSRVQQVSDLHLKVTLRPHHVWKYGRHPISGGWE